MQSNNVDIARRYLGELWSHGRLEAASELVAPGCTVRDPLFGECVGSEALGARVREMRRTFPGMAWTIEEILADAGPQLALTWSATARSVKVRGLLLLRFEGGKLIAVTSRWDPHDLLRQQPPRLPRLARGSSPAISTPAAPAESEVDTHWEL